MLTLIGKVVWLGIIHLNRFDSCWLED